DRPGLRRVPRRLHRRPRPPLARPLTPPYSAWPAFGAGLARLSVALPPEMEERWSQYETGEGHRDETDGDDAGQRPELCRWGVSHRFEVRKPAAARGSTPRTRAFRALVTMRRR